MARKSKPTIVDLMTYLIQRRDLALQNITDNKQKGNDAQALAWQSVSVDAGGMLAYISGDEYWTILATRDAQDWQRNARVMDDQLKGLAQMAQLSAPDHQPELAA